MSGLHVRRSEHLLFYCCDCQLPDISSLLRGAVELAPLQQIYAIAMLAGEQYAIGRADLLLLLNIPSDRWISEEELARENDVDVATLERFARQGILVCDAPDDPFRTLLAREETLSSTPWNLHAALYHTMKKWQGVRIDLVEGGQEPMTIDRLIEEHGRPPPHFHSVDGAPSYALPDAPRDDGLYGTLLARRTIRSFDRQAQLKAEDLGTILRYVFGCQAFIALRNDAWLLKKTSPSGGATHPIEVYPLLRSVQGFGPGLYHYSVERHQLESVQPMDEAEVDNLALLAAAGQTYARDAQALFLLTARFPRSFWKYRRHEKAYGVVLMDAGHLSQTFYLVCTDLGLGPFVTAAMNEVDVEEALGIDGVSEGAVAILGCGVAGPRDPALDPVVTPYSPEPPRA